MVVSVAPTSVDARYPNPFRSSSTPPTTCGYQSGAITSILNKYLQCYGHRQLLLITCLLLLLSGDTTTNLPHHTTTYDYAFTYSHNNRPVSAQPNPSQTPRRVWDPGIVVWHDKPKQLSSQGYAQSKPSTPNSNYSHSSQRHRHSQRHKQLSRAADPWCTARTCPLFTGTPEAPDTTVESVPLLPSIAEKSVTVTTLKRFRGTEPSTNSKPSSTRCQALEIRTVASDPLRTAESSSPSPLNLTGEPLPFGASFASNIRTESLTIAAADSNTSLVNFTVVHPAFALTVTSATVNSNCCCRVAVKQVNKSCVSPNTSFQQYKWCQVVESLNSKLNPTSPLTLSIANPKRSVDCCRRLPEESKASNLILLKAKSSTVKSNCCRGIQSLYLSLLTPNPTADTPEESKASNLILKPGFQYTYKSITVAVTDSIATVC